MKSTLISSLLAGVFFGTWPLIMNRSGLPSFTSAVVYAVVSLCLFLPLMAWMGEKPLSTGSLQVGAVASLCGASGMFFFVTMLSKASQKEVGTLFVLMTLVQFAIPVAYQIIQTGGISFRQVGGVCTAIIAIILLA